MVTKSPISSRERMLLAMTNQQADRVPVAPDISNMIPARLTGRPFWDIYIHDNPPLWRAYVEAVRYFGFDGWVQYGGSVQYLTRDDKRTFTTREIARSEGRITLETVCSTPAGDLTQQTVYYVADPPTVTKKWVTNLAEDLPKLRYFFPEIVNYDAQVLREQERAIGEDGATGPILGLPGFHNLIGWIDGGLEAAIAAYYDHTDLVEEFLGLEHANAVRQCEMLLDAQPQFLMIGASGLLTLSSPALVRRYTLPTLQAITRMAKQAGVPTMLHSCGKERLLVDMFATETDLDCINPLEAAPMGDCDLREVKQAWGHRIALFGNINTPEIMLRGTPAEVERVARQCIDDAAVGGGFILSTGDQCGRDTPDANIFKLVEVAKTYGRYD
ncbi:MAG: uroporphyrinogen decarboxylase family protein [Anaerolineae bacterium]